MQRRLTVFDPLIDTAAIGPTGVGQAGPMGPSGPTGASGIAGGIGATGATGVTGGVGGLGATGATGAAGGVGGLGATGATGVAGGVGGLGATGATGVAGGVGPQIATGILSTSQVAQLLQNHTMTGGGTVTIKNVGGTVRARWDTRILAVPLMGHVTATYYDIICPASGAALGAGTVNSDGISLGQNAASSGG